MPNRKCVAMERFVKKIELTFMVQQLCLLSTDHISDEHGYLSEEIALKALELAQLLEQNIERYNKDGKSIVYYLLAESFNSLAKKKITNSMFKKTKALYFYELAVKYYRESVKCSQKLAKESLYMAYYHLAKIQLSLGHKKEAANNFTQCITFALSSAHFAESSEDYFRQARGFYWAGKGFERLGGENINTALNYYKKGILAIDSIESDEPGYYVIKKDLYYRTALLESSHDRKRFVHYLGESINASYHLLPLIRRPDELIDELIRDLGWYADACHENNNYKKEKKAIHLLIALLSDTAPKSINPDINISKISLWMGRLYQRQEIQNDKNADKTAELHYMLRSYLRSSRIKNNKDW